jgi:Tol biopolymer transport system component
MTVRTVIAFTSLVVLTVSSMVYAGKEDLPKVGELSFVVEGRDGILFIPAERVKEKRQTEVIYSKTAGESINCPQFLNSSHDVLFSKVDYGKNTGGLYWYARNDKKLHELVANTIAISPVVSPDGKYIAFLSDRHFDGKKSLFNLYIYDLGSKTINKVKNARVKHDTAYNTAISWFNDSSAIAYTNEEDYICRIDLAASQITKYIEGYDPIISPSGRSVLFKTTENKPYRPAIYNFASKKIRKINVFEVLNAVWSKDDDSIVLVRNISRIWKWNEWEREVSIYDLKTSKRTKVFNFEGYEYIDRR